MDQQTTELKQLQQIIRLLQLDPEQRTNKMIQNIIKDDNYFPQLASYLPNQDQEVKVQCLKYMRYEVKGPNTPVFNIDEKGDKFYLILQGNVGVYIRKNKDDSSLFKVKELSTGQGFGELALISNKLRSASIICHTVVHLASLEKSKFNIVLKSIEQQKLNQNLLNLTLIPYFSNWGESLLKQIFHNSFKQLFHKNEQVFVENQETNSVYIILQGEFMQSKSFKISEKDIESNSKLTELKKNFIISESNNNMKNIQLTIMQKNELFGEEDIIELNEKRSFTVTCISLEGEVMMIKQKDFQRIMMSENRTRELIEKRLSMKNVVRNARIASIAAQFDKQSYKEYQKVSPKKAETTRNGQVQNGSNQHFEEEFRFYRSKVEKMFIQQEEELKNENHIAQKKQSVNEKLSNSPTHLAKKKVQKDVMIKGFQEQLKLNMVKKFNHLQIDRLQNHIPENMIENIDKNDGDAKRQINLKQRHNNDIRLTDEQKQTYQNILKKRQFMEQAQNEYNQRTFTHLVSCTSLENLNKSSSYFIGSLSSRNTIAAVGSKQRFSTPEVQFKKQNNPIFSAYFQFEQTPSNNNLNNSHNNIKSSLIAQIQSQSSSNNISVSKVQKQKQTRDTQTLSPLDRSSLKNIPSSGLIKQQHKSDTILFKNERFRLKKCLDKCSQPLRTAESEQNISITEIAVETPKRKVVKQVVLKKHILPLQNQYYNNFTNPYHNVTSQIKKKKQFEEKIKGIIQSSNQQQTTTQNIVFDQKSQDKSQF